MLLLHPTYISMQPFNSNKHLYTQTTNVLLGCMPQAFATGGPLSGCWCVHLSNVTSARPREAHRWPVSSMLASATRGPLALLSVPQQLSGLHLGTWHTFMKKTCHWLLFAGSECLTFKTDKTSKEPILPNVRLFKKNFWKVIFKNSVKIICRITVFMSITVALCSDY